MLFNILSFELNFWRKRAITYIFPIIIFIITALLFSVENVSFGSDITYRNSPSSLNTLYYVFSILLLPLFVNSFISSAVTRDYENKFDQIIYSLPISKTQVLIGRFIGGCIVVSLIFIGVVLADLIAPLLPWANTDLLGPFRWDAHIQNYFMVALPNIFIVGSILFLIASWTRNMNSSFLGAIALVVIILALQSLTNKIDNKTIVALLDPYAAEPIRLFTKKWSAIEKNTKLFEVDWRYWTNRAIWISFSLILWMIALKFNKFNFAKSKKKEETNSDRHPEPQTKLIKTEKDFSWEYFLKNLHFQAKIDFLHIIRSPAFYVVIGLICLLFSMNIIGSIQSDSASELATTNNTINFLGAINQMMMLAIIYFSGMLIWKERDNKVQDIYDSMPIKTSAMYLGKLLSIFYLMILLSIFILIIGIIYQFYNGVYIIDWSHYFLQLFVFDIFDAICLAIISMFFQVVINNKFVAYFVSCILMIGESFIKEWIDISSNLFSISPSLPSRVFSDFYGYGIYKLSTFAFMGYWMLIYSLIALITYFLFVRGKMNTFKERLHEAKLRFSSSKLLLFALLFSAICYGGFMYYQTKVVNTYFSKKENLERSAYYEKTFKKLENYPKPKVFHVDYKINLYPHDRRYEVFGRMHFVHTSNTPIDKVYINNDLRFPFDLNIKGAKLIQSDKKSAVEFMTYQLEKPMVKGDSITIDYKYNEGYSGVENEIENKRLLANGTFLDYGSFTPMLGYLTGMEIEDKSDREKYKLPVKAEEMPELEKECSEKCNHDYIGGMADWATIHTVISTVNDQIAIAPGTLVKSWKDDSRTDYQRNYFEYNLSQPSKFFFSIVSGKFELLRDTTHGVNCEVYYHAGHKYNVPEMMKALKKSIAYYSKNFGKYMHTEARIIEFPQFSSFAQAFPGTMPYSESIGFTSNLVKNPEDVNEIFHIVSHEMAHQWWAHQVTGARMQGATLLSESLAEYSSLKLLEKEYGMDMTSKFLKQSNNIYIFSRAQETKKESALFQVDNQGYIHYRKGSLVLYGIQQLIGEQKMNLALSSFIKKFAYKDPPYPSSYALLDEIYALTPDSLRETVKDGLERIILFQSDIKEAKSIHLANKSFETSISFSMVKNTIDPNAKQSKNIKDIVIGQSKESPVKDYFDIGLYQDINDKSRYGKLISIQRFYLNKKENNLKLLSKIKPDKIVIDPYFIHIHKDPEDNIKKL
jgi:ABC-type transport system involved in multi-copper enzyme maturation permease subunit